MKSILIIEDELELGENIKDLLDYLGYHVSGIIDNGNDALTFLKKNKPDLILMDIQLKGEMDGITLCQKIKSFSDIPVVYLTAFSDESFLDRIASHPYDGYLLKPFTLDELRSTLHLVLNAREKKKVKQDKNVITIKDKGFTVPVSLNDILFFQADGLYTKIQAKTKAYVVRDILKDMVEDLPHSKFVRVHKSFVVNHREISSFNSKELHIKEFIIPIRRGFFKEIKNLVRGGN